MKNNTTENTGSNTTDTRSGSWGRRILAAVAAMLVFSAGTLPDRLTIVLFGLAATLIVADIFLASRRKVIMQKVFVAFISGCLTLGAADMCLRIFHGRINSVLYYTPHHMYLERWHMNPDLPRFKRNVSYEGETYGNLAAVSGNTKLREPRRITFRTDELGFKNLRGAAQSGADVIIIGDSFAAGMGTEQENTWPRVLAYRTPLIIYNLGIGGTSPWEQSAILAAFLPKLKVNKDAVILWCLFSGNDLDEDYWPGVDVRQLAQEANSGLYTWKMSFVNFRFYSPIRRIASIMKKSRAGDQSSTAKQIKTVTLSGGEKILVHGGYELSAGRSRKEVVAHKNYKELKRTIRAVKKFADGEGLRVQAVLFPTKTEVYSWAMERGGSAGPSGFSQELAEIFSQNGIPFLDLKPLLISESKLVYETTHELLWWRDDSHLNVAGHEAIASILIENNVLSK